MRRQYQSETRNAISNSLAALAELLRSGVLPVLLWLNLAWLRMVISRKKTRELRATLNQL